LFVVKTLEKGKNHLTKINTTLMAINEKIGDFDFVF
jgi:hypothetical protein